MGEQFFGQNYFDQFKPDFDIKIDSDGVCLVKYNGNDEKVVVPDGVTKIAGAAFSDCGNLKIIELPSGLEEIGEVAFRNNGFEHITIPNSVKTIKHHAFAGCENLKTAELPIGLKKIDDAVFIGCKNLKTIELPSGLEEIGKMAFDDCGLEHITLHKGVKRIDWLAFAECENLKSVTIQNSALEMEWGVFSECYYLEDVYVPSDFPYSDTSSIWEGANIIRVNSQNMPESKSTKEELDRLRNSLRRISTVDMQLDENETSKKR